MGVGIIESIRKTVETFPTPVLGRRNKKVTPLTRNQVPTVTGSSELVITLRSPKDHRK